jgi:pimeloyl-ACP methyl ester carboxylesterase
MRLLTLLVLANRPQALPPVLVHAESLHVAVAGSEVGPPVVLIPGLFGSAFAYRIVVPRLTATGYRAIVIEPLGIGASTRPERADYSLTAQADRIATTLDRLGVTQAVVVAHSVGASMAYRLAYRRPDLVRGIVALEGGPAEAAATRGFRRMMKLAPWIKLFGGARLIRKKIHHYLIAASGDTSWVSEAVVDGYTAGAARDLDGTLKAYLGMAHAREPERLRHHLAEVRCPVHLLLGGIPHQGGPPASEVALLSQLVPTLLVDTVPGVGHFVYEEQPETVVAAVARFGASPPPPTASAIAGERP